jgi:sulfite exporter TauE/SafE
VDLSGFATIAGVGLVLGFRHAFEPDHLAAVSTLATRQAGGRVRDVLRLGAAWGTGHTASVAAVVLLLVLADVRLPAVVLPFAELGVAALLIGLGVGVLVREARRHARSLGEAHRHAHAVHAPHDHVPPIRDTARSLGFGLAHGLAGSGAVIVLLVATATTASGRLAYLAAFGSGTILGMLAASAAVAAATRAASGRSALWARRLHLTAAAVSIVIGVMLGAQTLGR